MDSSKPSWRPRGPALLVASLLVSGAGQLVLVTLPQSLHLPRRIEEALRPMWPDAAAAGTAAVLFLVAAALAARAAPSAATPGAWGEIAPEWPARRAARWAVLAPALLGAVLYGRVLAGASAEPPARHLGAWFALALALFAVAVVVVEGAPFRRVPRCRVTAAGLLEALYVVAAVAALWIVCTRDRASWYYSSLGDEYAFYDAAAAFARGGHPMGLFSQEGVYGIIPALSSVWQGQLMRLFGTDAASWKLVTVVPLPVMLLLLYLLARTLYGRLTAVLALGFLASSHYLIAYAHTGYPNLEPLLPTVAALLLLVLGLRRGRRLLLLGAGGLAGLGWYTYYTSRAAVVIVVAAVFLVARRADRRRALSWVGLGFLALVLPMIASSGSQVLERMVEQAGNGPTDEAASDRAMLPVWNAGRSILAFNYNTHDGPYLHGSLAEPVTAALLVVGVGWLAGAWGDRRSRLLLAWLAVGLLAAGVLSKYDYVSVSRLNFLLPAVALAAGVAARQAIGALETATSGRTLPALAGACLLGAAATLNLERFLVQAPASVQSTPEAVTLRVVLGPRCREAPRPPLVVADGVGGALPHALGAQSAGARLEWGLYGGGREWIETADSRCVVFLKPLDPASAELRAAMLRRWPSLRTVREPDRSGKVDVLVSYPASARGASAP